MKRNITGAIDFGNQSSILSIPTDNGIDIILNESSNRKTPTIVSYQEGRRTAGEFAQQQQMMNIDNTITEIKQLIKQSFNSEQKKNLNDSVSFKIIKQRNGSAAVKLNNNKILTIEQITGYYLKHLFELFQNKNKNVKQIVLTVPPLMNEVQRRSIINAAKISNVKIACLLDSSLAAAISYVKIHGNRFEKESNVLFIEFGDTSMNVFIGKLSKDSVEIKSNLCDESLGGQHFNDLLEKYLMKKVFDKYKIDPTKNKRSIIRFKQAVEKAKKTLSSNPVVLFEIPSLMNDIDVSMQIKREEFINLIKEDLNKIGPNIENVIKKAGLNKSDISFIEIIGGGSRIPSIKDQIKNIMGNDAKMSLDLDECFAIGAGFMAAKIDGKNIGINIINERSCPYEITLDSEEQKDYIKLFDKSTKIPASKKISIPIKQNKKFTFFSNQIPIGITSIETGIDEEVNIEIEIEIDSFGLINVKNAIIKSNGNKNQKCKSFNYMPFMSLSSSDILNYQKVEKEQSLKDKLELEIDNTKNDLESLIFSTENELKSCKLQEKSQIEKDLKSIHDWFDENEFERLKLDDYKSKINEITKIKKNISLGYQNQSKINQLHTTKQKLEKILDEVKKDTERIQTEESIYLQSEIPKQIKTIDDIIKSSNQIINSFDVNELNKEVDEIQRKLKSLKETSIEKKKKIKKRRNRKATNQPQQIFKNRLSDTWSFPFGMRNNLFGDFYGNPLISNQISEDEYEYSYENENQIVKKNNNNQSTNNNDSFADQIKKKANEKQAEEKMKNQKEEKLRKQKEIENHKKTQIEQEEKLKKQRKEQIEKENQRRAQIENEKKLKRQKEAEMELEMQRRAQIEQEKQRSEKEAEMYQRERLINDQWRQKRWNQSAFNQWGANIQRQSVQPRQYQYQPQQRRVVPGYGYQWGF